MRRPSLILLLLALLQVEGLVRLEKVAQHRVPLSGPHCFVSRRRREEQSRDQLPIGKGESPADVQGGGGDPHPCPQIAAPSMFHCHCTIEVVGDGVWGMVYIRHAAGCGRTKV